MMKFVELTPAEKGICTKVGKLRFDYAVERKLDAGLGTSQGNEKPDNSIRGAKAEFAASVMLNLYWRPTIGQLHQKDIGGFIEVRSIINREHRLIVKPDADNPDPYVLVFIEKAYCEFAGWEYAEVAKQEPLQDYDVDLAHYLDQQQLRPQSELISVIRERRC